MWPPPGMFILLPLTVSHTHWIYTQGLTNSSLIFTYLIYCALKINHMSKLPFMRNSWRKITSNFYNKDSQSLVGGQFASWSLTSLLEINTRSWVQSRFPHLVLGSGTLMILMPTPLAFEHHLSTRSFLRACLGCQPTSYPPPPASICTNPPPGVPLNTRCSFTPQSLNKLFPVLLKLLSFVIVFRTPTPVRGSSKVTSARFPWPIRPGFCASSIVSQCH